MSGRDVMSRDVTSWRILTVRQAAQRVRAVAARVEGAQLRDERRVLRRLRPSLLLRGAVAALGAVAEGQPARGLGKETSL